MLSIIDDVPSHALFTINKLESCRAITNNITTPIYPAIPIPKK